MFGCRHPNPDLRLKPCLVVMIMTTRLIPTPDLPLHTQDKYPTEFRLSKDQQQNYIYILCRSGDFSEKNSIADLLKVIFFARSKFSLIKFCAEICTKIVIQICKI